VIWWERRMVTGSGMDDVLQETALGESRPLPWDSASSTLVRRAGGREKREVDMEIASLMNTTTWYKVLGPTNGTRQNLKVVWHVKELAKSSSF